MLTREIWNDLTDTPHYKLLLKRSQALAICKGLFQSLEAALAEQAPAETLASLVREGLNLSGDR